MQTVRDILVATWEFFFQVSPYIMLGFIVAGIIHIFVSEETIVKYLRKGRFRSVFLAALFGVPLPMCSCGVLPTAAALHKKGANRGATVAFLISTPESGVDSMALTYALIDLPMTLIRPIAAFITGITAGILENLFGYREEVGEEGGPEKSCHCAHCAEPEVAKENILGRIRSGLRFAFVVLLGDIAGWFIVGLIAAGIITHLFPQSLVERYLGGGIYSMLGVLAISVPLYICASASTPVAAALILKGMSPGTALVFLLTGPATNIASFTVISGFLGKRAAAIYLGTIVVCSILLGLGVDVFYSYFAIQPTALTHHDHGGASQILNVVASIALLALMANALGRKYWQKVKGRHDKEECCEHE